MKYAILFLFLSSSALAQESIVVTTAASVPIVNSWCSLNGERWAEHGGICHANPHERSPVMCAARDATGAFVTDPGVMCTIPSGWENVNMGSIRDKVYRSGK